MKDEEVNGALGLRLFHPTHITSPVESQGP
jgi:hypothetical protein